MSKSTIESNHALKNVREAIANNRLENLKVNKDLIDRVTKACENNEQLDFEKLIDEFVNQSTKYCPVITNRS
ncbi:hypothetical protein [Neptunicella sp.]|uniref:hypothetical protein n=1 Tax=Neptunicella sp. TaxID=2125986 RepID=UPI003F68FB04